MLYILHQNSLLDWWCSILSSMNHLETVLENVLSTFLSTAPRRWWAVEAVAAMSSPEALNGRPVAAAVPWRDCQLWDWTYWLGAGYLPSNPYFQVIWGLEWAIRILIYQPDYQYNGMSQEYWRYGAPLTFKCFSRHHGVFPCFFQACRVVSKCNVMAYDIHTILIWV